MSSPNLPEFFHTHPSSSPWLPSLKLAAEAANAAGQIIKDGYDLVHQTKAKGVGDLVSKVDLDADRAATKILESDSDRLLILSEELNPTAANEQQDMWIVDPLDASTAYLMKAGPQYPSVLIAKRINGQTQLGIVYCPLSEEWFYAVKGEGAWKDGKPLQVPNNKIELSDCWVEMNQYGDQRFETPFFRSTKSALRAPGGAKIVTSNFPHASVAMRIAEPSSRLSIAIHDNNPASLKQGPWDIAANQIIFEEAGGVFVNPDGDRTCLFRAEPIIIAPSMHLATQVVEICKQTAV